tara:strand:+ start:46 stop:795 length:750 start_codon:yes stop_codon:yes gene_type:complete
MIKNKFNIIVPFYNVEKWIKYCVRSVKAQEYKNYHCYLIDDISTDKSASIIEKEIAGKERFTLIKNVEKKYALLNIYDTLKNNSIDNDDIIVILDGDDWLANKKVLSMLNSVYNEGGCYMTYGSYVEYPSRLKGKFSRQVPEKIIVSNSYRESPWLTSHLKTFKYCLWKKVQKKDFVFSKTKKFYKSAWDLALMYPMLEMSGYNAKYIDEPMYVYNRQNPLNEDKINQHNQSSEEMEIRLNEKYSLCDI